jgi:hypothetical protein
MFTSFTCNVRPFCKSGFPIYVRYIITYVPRLFLSLCFTQTHTTRLIRVAVRTDNYVGFIYMVVRPFL